MPWPDSGVGRNVARVSAKAVSVLDMGRQGEERDRDIVSTPEVGGLSLRTARRGVAWPVLIASERLQVSQLDDAGPVHPSLVVGVHQVPLEVPGTETRFKQLSNARSILVKPSCPQLSTLTSFARSEVVPP